VGQSPPPAAAPGPALTSGAFSRFSLDVQQHVDRRDEFGAGLRAVGHDALDGAGLHRVAYLESDALLPGLDGVSACAQSLRLEYELLPVGG